MDQHDNRSTSQQVADMERESKRLYKENAELRKRVRELEDQCASLLKTIGVTR